MFRSSKNFPVIHEVVWFSPLGNYQSLRVIKHQPTPGPVYQQPHAGDLAMRFARWLIPARECPGSTEIHLSSSLSRPLTTLQVSLGLSRLHRTNIPAHCHPKTILFQRFLAIFLSRSLRQFYAGPHSTNNP